MNGDLIGQFVEPEAMQALEAFLSTDDIQEAAGAACRVAQSFAGPGFGPIAGGGAAEEKLVASFHSNLLLLIQKTWVEKSDEELKAQVLYHLEEFTRQISGASYAESYGSFLGIVDTVVYLMFGAQTKGKDFAEYALRIDPEFGIFWWYMQSLPQKNGWPAEKRRLATLLGMYFLANY